ncbi:hypothetical protein H1Q78_06325 [Cellulosimicrobium cellulans]|uniref:hypothetical protein n=1 Tax=Cellulosimicrobium cellulans TaxID=1710 RepID=UPI001EDC0F0F|nr:hypothetical protein [Cellulosimicrobium cellulans]UKJ64976.1 hypothetical protein H1Q78_06325 [Cellulosimicrobium cellulans]
MATSAREEADLTGESTPVAKGVETVVADGAPLGVRLAVGGVLIAVGSLVAVAWGDADPWV